MFKKPEQSSSAGRSAADGATFSVIATDVVIRGSSSASDLMMRSGFTWLSGGKPSLWASIQIA